MGNDLFALASPSAVASKPVAAALALAAVAPAAGSLLTHRR